MGKFSRVCVSSSVEQIVHRVAVKFNSLEQSIDTRTRDETENCWGEAGIEPRSACTVSDSLVHDALEQG